MILQVKKLTFRKIAAWKWQGNNEWSELPLSLYHIASMSTSLPWTNHPKWVSTLHKSYVYSCHGAPCLLGDGKLLKAGTLVISTFLFPECLAQWTFLCVEVKQHTLTRRDLENLRASCPPDRCAYLHICPNAQQSVIKGHPRGRFNSLAIIHDLSTYSSSFTFSTQKFWRFYFSGWHLLQRLVGRRNMKFYTPSLLL